MAGNVQFVSGINYLGGLFNNTDAINANLYLWVSEVEDPAGSELVVGGGVGELAAIQDTGWTAQAVIMGTDATGAASGGPGAYAYTVTINQSGGGGSVQFTDTSATSNTAWSLILSENSVYGGATPPLFSWNLGGNVVPASGTITITNAALRIKIP